MCARAQHYRARMGSIRPSRSSAPAVPYPMRHTTRVLCGHAGGFADRNHSFSAETRLVYGATNHNNTQCLRYSAQIYRWNAMNVSAKEPTPFIVTFIHTAFPNALCFLMCGLAMMLLAGTRPSVHRPVFAAIAGAFTATLGLCGLANEVERFIPANPAFEGEISVDATISLLLLGYVMARVSYVKVVVAGEQIGEDREFHRR